MKYIMDNCEYLLQTTVKQQQSVFSQTCLGLVQDRQLQKFL